MSEKSDIFKQVVKHKGFYNYAELYNFCYDWLKSEDYLVEERQYLEKMTSYGKEVKIEWKAWKKISDYYKNVIEVTWHILGMNDAEVEENGKKIKTNKGEVKITFVGVLERDYEDTWEKEPFWKFMRSIYDKYIMRTTQDEYEVRLINKAQAYVEDVKSFLNLEGRREQREIDVK